MFHSTRTMSNVSFRDASVVLIDTSRTLVQAGLGLADLFRTPSVVRRGVLSYKTCALTVLYSVSNSQHASGCANNSAATMSMHLLPSRMEMGIQRWPGLLRHPRLRRF